MIFTSRSVVLAVFSIFLLQASCAARDFEAITQVVQEDPISKVEYEDFDLTQHIAYQPVKEVFVQDVLDKNKTWGLFQVVDRLGRGVANLKPSDFELVENSTLVRDFDVDSSSVNLGKKVDIVFVLDVTNSMQRIIDQVKSKVRLFADSYKNHRVDGTLCLVTFRDETVKKCTVILPDDPATSINENVEQFLLDVSQARTRPAGDWNENQLRGLMDAALATPWRDGAQRMAIMITNSTFSYAPDNKGNAGDLAPRYSEALTALRSKFMQVFVVAPARTNGYDRAFSSSEPSLVDATGGRFYEYNKVLSGEIRLEDIFNQMIDAAAVSYRLDYIVDDNVGLRPDLPFSRRQIQLRAKNANHVIRNLSWNTNMPLGKAVPKSKFDLPLAARESQHNFSVKVSGLHSQAMLQRSQVLFDVAPPEGTLIEVTYDPEFLLSVMRGELITLPVTTDISNLGIVINGNRVSMDQARMSRNSRGELLLDPNLILADFADPFKVVESRGLEIKIFGRKEKSRTP